MLSKYSSYIQLVEKMIDDNIINSRRDAENRRKKMVERITLELADRPEEEETKGEKFERLAELRVNNAEKSIDLITQLCNKNNYDWSETQAKKIIIFLDKAMDRMQTALEGKAIATSSFSFSEKE